MQNKLDGIRQKLFLDNHHKMERFCLLFVIFIILIGLIFGICFKEDQDKQKLNLSTKALYTTTAEFSLTGETISLLNLYRNDNFTKAFILLKVNGGMDNLSVNPKDYQVLATGKESKITCNPTCGVYMFGTTGYMGLYFTDSAGFNSALYDMILRNYVMVGDHSNPGAAEKYGDKSYAAYNQAHFFVNLRGEDGIVADFLNSDQIVVEDIYKEIVSDISYQEAVKNANNILSDMNGSMARLNEYKVRLENYGIVVPSLPIMVSGDKIVTDDTLTASNPVEYNRLTMSEDSLISIDSSYSSGDDAFSVVKAVSESDKLYLVTDYVYPGGVQFNYQTSKVTDAFLSKLYPDSNITYRDFASNKTIESQTYKVSYSMPEKWYYKTGSEFMYDQVYAGEDMKQINTTIEAYNAELSNLCELKRSYQCTYLPAILKIEADSASVVSLIDFYSSKNSIILY